MSKYTVREGESLIDVCYNGCGSLGAIYQIMTLNGFDTFTPQLTAGQELEIPETLNNDGVIVANKRPFNSNLLPQATLDKLLKEVAQEEEPIPTMQFTIIVKSSIDPQYRVDGGRVYDLEIGTNVLDIPENFSTIDIITDNNHSVTLLKDPNGQYIGSTYLLTYTFKRSENPDVTTLTLYDEEPTGIELSFTLMPSGQGDIEYEVTAYPSGDILATFTDEAGVAQPIDVPEETYVLEIYGYNNRGGYVHTPKLLTTPAVQGADGYTSIGGYKTRNIKGKTITIE